MIYKINAVLFLDAMAERIMTLTDFLLMPFIAAALIYIFKYIRDTRYKNELVAKYFLPALIARLVGAFLTGLMYRFYYGYGDTTWYFQGCSDIVNAFFNKGPRIGFEMIFNSYAQYSFEAKECITYHLLFKNPSMLAVCKTGSIFGLFTFGSFIGCSFGLTCISFVGCWMLFRVLTDLYPHLHRSFAFAILFVPSLCFWGTGLMKDPLSLGGVGMYVYGLYYTVFKFGKKGILPPLFFLVIGLYFSLVVKAYIAFAVIPASIVWISLLYKNKIKNKFLKSISGPLLLIMGIGLGGSALGRISNNITLDQIASEAAKIQWWISLNTEKDGGTGYSLGVMDPTASGMLRIAPAAINVALFRPYPWEARKPIVIPSAIESLFTLCFTLFVFYKIGILKTFVEIQRDPTVLFCIIFSLIFSFAVGFTSMNFGALARYKIPAIPFYFTALVILLDSKGRKERMESFTLNPEKKSITDTNSGLPLQ
jgi:hypothetical protein